MNSCKLLPVLLLLLMGLCLRQFHCRATGHCSLRRQARAHHHHQNITLAVILPQRNTAYPWAWPRVGPALERALRTVNADPGLLPDYHLRYIFKDSENKEGICSESVAPLMAVDLKFDYDPWAFIGPGCTYTSSPVGLFTTHWDVPMVTAGAPAVGFDGVNVYPSITNTGPTHKKLGKFALHICEQFGWKEHVLLVFSDYKVDDRPCYFAVEGLYTELHKENIITEDLVLEDNRSFFDTLLEIQQLGRVVFVCCPPDTFRQLMVHFWRAGLPQEEYVFLYIDVFGHSLNSKPFQPWARGDADDSVAKEAFQSVKILTYKEPENPEYKDFVHHLKTDAKRMFNYTVEDSLMNIISGGFYDGLMLYTHALNETLESSGRRPLGKTVTRRMWNRTYHAIA
ncbi:atrial natriuretic peptide receptor 1-like [Aplochiton taeniatus]